MGQGESNNNRFVKAFGSAHPCDLELLFQIKDGLLALRQELTIGDIRDFTVFTGAVIDAVAFKRISGYIEYAKKSPNLKILGGGGCDDSYVLLQLLLT